MGAAQGVANSAIEYMSSAQYAAQYATQYAAQWLAQVAMKYIVVAEITQLTTLTREEAYEYYRTSTLNKKIDRKRLVETYNKFTGAKLTLEVCDNIFKSIGEDINGNVSFLDLRLALFQIVYGSEEEKLSWAFRVYDTNNDGLISLQELTDIIQSFRNDFPDAQDSWWQSSYEASNTALDIMRKVDDNRDGKLSFEEFKMHFTDCLEIIDLANKGIGYTKKERAG